MAVTLRDEKSAGDDYNQGRNCRCRTLPQLRHRRDQQALKWGEMEFWIIEVWTKEGESGSAYNAGDRWFMTIKNGLVQGPQGNEYITACRWNKANSLSLSLAAGFLMA